MQDARCLRCRSPGRCLQLERAPLAQTDTIARRESEVVRRLRSQSLDDVRAVRRPGAVERVQPVGLRLFLELHRVGGDGQTHFGGRPNYVEGDCGGGDNARLRLDDNVGHSSLAQLHQVLDATQSIRRNALVGRVVATVTWCHQQIAAWSVALHLQIGVAQVLDEPVVPAPFDGGIGETLRQTTEIRPTLLPRVGGRQSAHVLETRFVLDRDVAHLERLFATIARHALVQTVVGTDQLEDAQRAGGLAALLVGGLLENDAIVGRLGTGGVLFGGAPASVRAVIQSIINTELQTNIYRLPIPKCDLRRWSPGRLARDRTLSVLRYRHIQQLIDPRPHQHVQQRFRLIVARRVLRQARVRTVVVLVHARNVQLARLRIHREPIGRRHILLRRVLDPRELGHRFAGRHVALHRELLLLDGLQSFGQVADARFDLHLDPDVALDQFAGLDDGRATRVDAVVRFVDVADEQATRFDHISAARLDLFLSGEGCGMYIRI